MRIGFFGGSFDPPHLGHFAVARAVASAFTLDRVLFVPAAHQPLKPEGAAASYADRYAMVSLLCELQPADTEPQLVASDLDAPLPQGAPNFTIDSLKRLRINNLPTDEIFAIVGVDAFLSLRSWRAPDDLLRLAQWIVVSRPAFQLQQLDTLDLTPEQQQRVHVMDGIEEPASATNIRALLRDRADCAELLPASILEYIRAHHLYERKRIP